MLDGEQRTAEEMADIQLLKEQQYELFIDESWQRDQYLIKAVETGDKKVIENMERLFPSFETEEYYYGNPKLEDDYLRERKNGLIIRNTLCRLGAERGGVPPRYLHNLSERIILLIEEQTSTEALNEKIGPMIVEEYIELVNRLSVLAYSNLVKGVVLYISENIQEALSLSTLADAFSVNPSHLSREFKKETGFNITDYINRQKMDLAKLYLIQEKNTVVDVSNFLNYNSSSYFSKTFKKFTGLSPSEYKS